LPLLDSPDQNIVAWFDKANAFISGALDANKDMKEGEKPNRVLVHCFAGKSRATSFTCGYLMCKKEMNLRDAIDLVKSKRPIA